MNAISGHNLVIQQSGAVSELTQGSNAPKPNPAHVEAQQAANAAELASTVKEFDEIARVKARKEKEREEKKAEAREKEKKKKEKKHRNEDPDAPGQLLDTVI